MKTEGSREDSNSSPIDLLNDLNGKPAENLSLGDSLKDEEAIYVDQLEDTPGKDDKSKGVATDDLLLLGGKPASILNKNSGENLKNNFLAPVSEDHASRPQKGVEFTFKPHPIIRPLDPGSNQMQDAFQKAIEERDVEIMKADHRLEMLRSKLELSEKESKEGRRKLEMLALNLEELQKAHSLKDNALEELQLEKKLLEVENASKTKLLRERQDYGTKSYVNSAIENQRRVYEAEIENRNLKIEMLEENLRSAEQRIELLRAPPRSSNDFFPVVDGSLEELKYQVRQLEDKLAEKNRFAQLNNSSDHAEKEALIAHNLLNGYTKENERMMLENMNLRKLITDMKGRLGESKLGGSTGLQDPTELQGTIQRLQEELQKKDAFYRRKQEESLQKLDHYEVLVKKSLEKDQTIAGLRMDVDQVSVA